MTVKVLGEAKSGQGQIVAIDESPEERKARLEMAFENVGARFGVTAGQRKELRKAFFLVQVASEEAS